MTRRMPPTCYQSRISWSGWARYWTVASLSLGMSSKMAIIKLLNSLFMFYIGSNSYRTIFILIQLALTAAELVPVPLLREFCYWKLVPLPRCRFHILIEGDTFKQFLSPTALLNDNSLNRGAALLQTQLLKCNIDAAASVAVLSTHDLVRIQYESDDNQLWRCSKHAEYWLKDRWVLPIHRPDTNHWVLCVIYPNRKRSCLFDSFVEEHPWNADIKVCVLLIF